MKGYHQEKKCCEVCGEKELLVERVYCWWECQLAQPQRKLLRRFFKRLTMNYHNITSGHISGGM
jgi:hypothetical protein